MQNYRSTDTHYAFSARLERVYGDMLRRLKPNRHREDTLTGPPCNGKTPFLDVFEEMGGREPYVICLAHAIVRSWMVSPVLIYPDEVLVGVTRPNYPHVEHFSYGIQDRCWALEDPAYAPTAAEYRARWAKIAKYAEPLSWYHMQDEGKRIFGAEGYQALNDEGFMWTGGYQGHTVPDYSMLLTLGIDGLHAKVQSYARHPKDERAAEMYRACEILLDGMSAWIMQYADCAAELAASEDDPDKKNAYLAIAENCSSVAHSAPRTLYEATQLMWFYCLWDWVDCIGRADQYFLPFYLRAREEGDVVTPEDSLGALMLKMLENGVHNITVGGVDGDGRDVTNELTFLMLQILRRLHDTHPRMSVRFHEGSPDDLTDLVTKMWAEGMSDPSVVGDKNVIEGLTAIGVPLPHARDYTMLGCQEIEIPGKSNFGCEDGSVNLAKLFEFALRDGKTRDGVQLGPKTGNFCDFETFDQLWEAYTAQVCFFVRHFVTLCNLGQEIRAANYAKLVKTLLTEGCLERGIPHDAGGPLYNYGVVETCGAAAVGDSLYAIKTLVYDKKVLTREGLMAALDADFVGYEKERQMMLRLPKFGNDCAEADEMAVAVLDRFWTEIGKYHSVRGDVFTGACSLLEAGISYGKNTGALPDGRFAGEPLGNSIGPRPGADHCGVTALFNSVSKLPLAKGVGGTTLNVVLTQKMLSDDKTRADVGNVLRAYLENGGQMAQITTANPEDLRDAQIHPERHGDLIIRIGGFSIQFVQLNTESQNEIISRYV